MLALRAFLGCACEAATRALRTPVASSADRRWSGANARRSSKHAKWKFMSDKARRKELVAQYRQTHPEAGVYRIVNREYGKTLLASMSNLASSRNKLDFARSPNTPSVLDQRLSKDIRELGMEAFTQEVLEVLETTPEMTPAQIRDDLAALETLWREKLDPALLY